MNAKRRSQPLSLEMPPILDVLFPQAGKVLRGFASRIGFAILSGLSAHSFYTHTSPGWGKAVRTLENFEREHLAR
jgi:hypothetical protein